MYGRANGIARTRGRQRPRGPGTLAARPVRVGAFWAHLVCSLPGLANAPLPTDWRAHARRVEVERGWRDEGRRPSPAKGSPTPRARGAEEGREEGASPVRPAALVMLLLCLRRNAAPRRASLERPGPPARARTRRQISEITAPVLPRAAFAPHTARTRLPPRAGWHTSFTRVEAAVVRRRWPGTHALAARAREHASTSTHCRALVRRAIGLGRH